MNTKISYLYRDADNYKMHNKCVIAGTLTTEQARTIKDSCEMGEYFIPRQVGLPERRFDRYDPAVDHCWFELDEDCSSETIEPPTVALIKMLADGRPITAEEYDELIALRMENTGKVTGVFDISFDKQEFSAVNIMDGWQSWSIRDMSTATYHATRPQFASNDEKWRKLLEHLGGKELTSAGHLSAQNFSFSDEVMMENGKLNFYVQADFDVDAAFGTFVCTDENDDWLNIYANYDLERGTVCDTLELNLCKADGSEKNWHYPLNAAEKEVLLRKMEEYCQQQDGMSLHDYSQQFREEMRHGSEMQM